MPGDDPARAPVLAEQQDPVEREVPDALPLRDPDSGRDVPTRVAREELRDREIEKVHVSRGVLQERSALDEARVLRMGLGLHETAEQRLAGCAKRRRDPVPRRPQIADRLGPVERPEVDGSPGFPHQEARRLDLPARVRVDPEDVVGEPLQPLAHRHARTSRPRIGSASLGVAGAADRAVRVRPALTEDGAAAIGNTSDNAREIAMTVRPSTGPGPTGGEIPLATVAISRALSLVFDSTGVTFPMMTRIVCSPTCTARNDCEYTVVDAPLARGSPRAT